ncbi:MAG: hypothetical protein KC561_13570 [Myxococcales bacterium]|nr:hypothetical protein [Myxococcales bacterium]
MSKGFVPSVAFGLAPLGQDQSREIRLWLSPTWGDPQVIRVTLDIRDAEVQLIRLPRGRLHQYFNDQDFSVPCPGAQSKIAQLSAGLRGRIENRLGLFACLPSKEPTGTDGHTLTIEVSLDEQLHRAVAWCPRSNHWVEAVTLLHDVAEAALDVNIPIEDYLG